MKMYMFSEEEIVEIMMRIMDVQDMMVAQEVDIDMIDILEEVLHLIEPEE